MKSDSAVNRTNSVGSAVVGHEARCDNCSLDSSAAVEFEFAVELARCH